MFHTAADPLLIGCLLALVSDNLEGKLSWLRRQWALPALFLALIAVSFFLGKPLASYWSLTIGTSIEATLAAGIVWSAHHGEEGPAHVVLRSWFFQKIGLASYSIYLWQNIFTRPNAIFDLPFAYGIGASLCVGYLSYCFIEKPTQRWAARRFGKKVEAN
jgi:peptidoglycan/LPS O-acetylase OafA/YrhL